jgi:hypothetical protein
LKAINAIGQKYGMWSILAKQWPCFSFILFATNALPPTMGIEDPDGLMAGLKPALPISPLNCSASKGFAGAWRFHQRG